MQFITCHTTLGRLEESAPPNKIHILQFLLSFLSGFLHFQILSNLMIFEVHVPSFSVDFIYNEERFNILSHCADGQETLMCFKDPEFEKTIG